jgi:hypothetical protein
MSLSKKIDLERDFTAGVYLPDTLLPPRYTLYTSGFRIRIHFLRIRIRIQWIRMEANTDPDTDPDPDPDPDPIRIQGFNDQKLKKNNSL